MSFAYTSTRLWVALRCLITNLPEAAVQFDLRLEAREIAVATIKIHCLGEDGKPVLIGGELATETRRFEVLPEGTASAITCLAVASNPARLAEAVERLKKLYGDAELARDNGKER